MTFWPFMSVAMMETATIGQMIRMFREQSAKGQEPLSWLIVTIGIFGWAAWYHIMTPDHKFPKYAALFGGVANSIGMGVVIYFRYFYV